MNQQNSNAAANDDQNDDSSTVNIQPSEPEGDAPDENEQDKPERTPGKAEGSLEIVEEDLAEKSTD